MKTKILIVEDDANIRFGLQEVLQTEGFAIAVCERGDDAVDAVVKEKPALVLLDIMLPGKSGYEICKALKSDPATREIPVIFLTARSMPSEIKDALDLGALGYLAKPFDPMSLVSQINELLSPVGCTIGG